MDNKQAEPKRGSRGTNSNGGKPGPPPPESERKPEGWPPRHWGGMFWYFAIMLVSLWFWQEAAQKFTPHTIGYSDFKELVAQNRVSDLAISDTDIIGKATPVPGSALATNLLSPAEPRLVNTSTNAHASPTAAAEKTPAHEREAAQPETFLFRTVRVDDPNLVAELQKQHISYTGVKPSVLTQVIWAWIIPIAVVMLLWRMAARRLGGLGQGLMSFSASRAKVVPDKQTGVTFSDVAGCDEAKYELQEVVSFLKDPQRYEALGAAIPKGVLLIGPPGTGKTLLARAVAGEAKVPFFLISGSDFVEMFVGVGAARVRDLFEKAKAQAPCIIFIDELDAVGRQRGVHLGPVNDEREQTLNQLLVGMDGFETNLGVIVLAATNRPEVLDHALLRPGRFDRQVVVDAPDLDGRLAILKLHVRNKPLEADVDLRKIAQQTPGFSGADLANVVNEAALLTARHQGAQIGQKDLDAAVDKVVAGPERKSRRLNEAEKRCVAYHETGHALVAAYSEHSDPVHKITIIPHGHAALGYTMQLPTEDHYLMNRSALLDKLRGLLGGRAAEEVVFGEVSTGAENDLQHATTLARQMVAMYGMSETVGLAHCAERQSPFTPSGLPDGVIHRDCSEETAREIDQEVRKILDQSYTDARAILREHRAQLDLVAAELLQHETIDGKTFHHLLGRDEQPAQPHLNGEPA